MMIEKVPQTPATDCAYTAAGRSLIGTLLLIVLLPAVRAQDIDREPIRYSASPPTDAVSRLQRRIDAGEQRLTYEQRLGYLRSVLRALNVPLSSQTLVFSKTSMQRHRIAPRTPRALYFSDDVYVGYCQRGAVMEVATVDPKLGAVFYSLDQKPSEKPRFVRQGDACLICHGSSQNQGFPGFLVRSVYPDASGSPILSMGTHRIDQSSPLAERWGGWYVTGTSGRQSHLGNLFVEEGVQPEQIDSAAGRNVTDLTGRFNTASYLTPHSDIVALMVLEHQGEMHNRLTRANFFTRMALYEEAEINKALGRAPGYRSESTQVRIKSAGEPVVEYMLMSGETALTDTVHGTSAFAEEFAQRGPHDNQGHSLRQLDLKSRLFAYPCSYVIYSDAFDNLPGPVKDYVLRRLWEILTGKDTSKPFAHLSSADRAAILQILLATKRDLPEYWRSGRG
jgi:hypothetical protein